MAPRPDRPSAFPLTPSQEPLWFFDRLATTGYNVVDAFRICGWLDASLLQRAFDALAVRHEILRTSFADRDGQPLQRVDERGHIPLDSIDFTAAADPECSLEQLVAQLAGCPFDLARTPLVRATLAALPRDEHALVLAIHPIIQDDRSRGILYRDLSKIYGALADDVEPALDALPMQFGDFAAWQQSLFAGEYLGEHRRFWRERLATLPPYLELWNDRPRPPVARHRVASVWSNVSPEVLPSLHALAEDESASLFAVLAAAYAALLNRFSGQPAFLVGFSSAGRMLPETDGLVGAFANTLVLPACFEGDPTFRLHVRNVRDTLHEVEAHGDYPFGWLAAEAQPQRDLSRTPLTGVLVSLVDGDRAPQFPGARTERLRINPGSTTVDLALEMTETERGLECRFQYDRDLFDSTTIEQLASSFGELLRGIAGNPDRVVSRLPLLGVPERACLIESGRGPSRPIEPVCAHESISRQALRTPDAVAVSCAGEQRTYRELNARANRIARALRAMGAREGAVVALFLERSVEMLAALLGVLKSGAAFLPLDPSLPKERLADMLSDADVGIVVTQTSLSPRLAQHSVQTVLLDVADARIDSQLADDPPEIGSFERLAYVLYTSGSTGRPKGVEVTHRSLAAFLQWAIELPGVSADDVVLAMSALSFDISLFELLVPLAAGARVVIVPRETAGDVTEVLELIARTQPTIVQATPSLWSVLIDIGWPGGPKTRVQSTGEALPRELAEKLLARSPVVWDLYGPTETTVWATLGQVTSGDGYVPLGEPTPNAELYVLDGHGELVPEGLPGELFIGGPGVASRYRNRPELTAERFIANPFSAEPGARLYRTGDRVRRRADGTLEYLGRLDRQLKIRGYRIEPGEIESALRAHASVASCVVTARAQGPGGVRLVAYVVPCAGADLETRELRAFLAERLPAYMVPAAYVTLDALPRNVNGKLDERALPAPRDEHATTDAGADLDPTMQSRHRQLQEIWARLLGLESVDVRADFFELGGDSLLAARLVYEVERIFGRRISLAALFEEPTIERLARILSEIGERAAGPLTGFQLEGDATPFFFFHGDYFGGGLYARELLRTLGPRQPLYLVDPHGFDGRAVPPSIEAMAAEYVELVRKTQPSGPYRLGGFSNGGLVAFEVARRLRSAGETVESVILVNTSAHLAKYAPLARVVQRVGAAIGLGPHARQWLFGALSRAINRATLVASRDGKRATLVQMWSRGTRALAQAYDPIMMVSRAYCPGPYDGRIALIWGTDQEAPVRGDQTMGWSKLAPKVDVRLVPGNHLSAVTEHFGTIAEHVRAALG
jgi:amino acid adenylation domain-containing protein